jgi:hypothetical protein
MLARGHELFPVQVKKLPLGNLAILLGDTDEPCDCGTSPKLERSFDSRRTCAGKLALEFWIYDLTASGTHFAKVLRRKGKLMLSKSPGEEVTDAVHVEVSHHFPANPNMHKRR